MFCFICGFIKPDIVVLKSKHIQINNVVINRDVDIVVNNGSLYVYSDTVSIYDIYFVDSQIKEKDYLIIKHKCRNFKFIKCDLELHISETNTNYIKIIFDKKEIIYFLENEWNELNKLKFLIWIDLTVMDDYIKINQLTYKWLCEDNKQKTKNESIWSKVINFFKIKIWELLKSGWNYYQPTKDRTRFLLKWYKKMHIIKHLKMQMKLL